MMRDVTGASARYGDLLLTVTQEDKHWRASVEVIDDPGSALSDGADYESSTKARGAAINLAYELFGTDIPKDDLAWSGF